MRGWGLVGGRRLRVWKQFLDGVRLSCRGSCAYVAEKQASAGATADAGTIVTMMDRGEERQDASVWSVRDAAATPRNTRAPPPWLRQF